MAGTIVRNVGFLGPVIHIDLPAISLMSGRLADRRNPEQEII